MQIVVLYKVTLARAFHWSASVELQIHVQFSFSGVLGFLKLEVVREDQTQA